MLSAEIEDEIKEKAFFVAGSRAHFRKSTDPQAHSAMHDAEKILELYKGKIPNPQIHAGTTSAPKTFLHLLWMFAGFERIRSVSIALKGSEVLDIKWETPDGDAYTKKNITIKDLKDLNLPNIIQSLAGYGQAPSPIEPPPNLLL